MCFESEYIIILIIFSLPYRVYIDFDALVNREEREIENGEISSFSNIISVGRLKRRILCCIFYAIFNGGF